MLEDQLLTKHACRFHFVYKFLGLPYHDVALLDGANGAEAKL